MMNRKEKILSSAMVFIVLMGIVNLFSDMILTHTNTS